MSVGTLAIGIGVGINRNTGNAGAASLLNSNVRIACVPDSALWDAVDNDFGTQPKDWDELGDACVWETRITADGFERVPAEYA